MRVQQHWRQHDHVAQKDRRDRLLPIHSPLDQTRGQHVGENVHRHRNPKRGKVVRAPVPYLSGGRSKIVVIERTGLGTGTELSGSGHQVLDHIAIGRDRGGSAPACRH